ncbi:MAG: DNA alkylation repair protein [Bacteroidaceae bacterium]
MTDKQTTDIENTDEHVHNHNHVHDADEKFDNVDSTNELEQLLRDIKKKLRLSMNGVISQSMRDKGLNYRINFGVEYPRIKSISSEYTPSSALATALWKSNIRECYIMATLLQPAEEFPADLCDVWIEQLPSQEVAQYMAMNLLCKLPYAPQLSFSWIADTREMYQVCGYLTIARLLIKRPLMDERSRSEFVDQLIPAALDESSAIRSAVYQVMRRFMEGDEQQAFLVCRACDEWLSLSDDEKAQLPILKQQLVCFIASVLA